MMRNLDASLRVILNESRLLRETMEDVEGRVGRLHVELVALRRTVRDRSEDNTRLSPTESEPGSPAGGVALGWGDTIARTRSPGFAPSSLNMPPCYSAGTCEHRTADGDTAADSGNGTTAPFALAPASSWGPVGRCSTENTP